MVSSSDRLFFGGFASGLDTNGIIDALISVQRRPIALQQVRRDTLQVEQSAFAKLNTKLVAFRTQLDGLRDPKVVGGRVASQLHKTEDIGKLSLSVSPNAPLTNFKLDILGLATSTTVDSGAPVGQAVDPNVALAQAGLGTELTFGTFRINGTAFTLVDDAGTAVTSTAAVGAAVDTTVALEQAGLTTAPAASGLFTINGTQIAYDATVDSLDTILARITASAAGVTATYDAAARTVTLEQTAPGPAAITLSDDTGNFLAAVDVLAASQTAGTNGTTLNGLLSQINGAGIGVTAALANDAGGRPNVLELTSGATIQLGSGADTSNFLSVAGLLDSPPGTTRTGQRVLGAVSQTAALSAARLETALSASTGAFTVNGVTFTYDEAVDSLSDIITRINGSDAKATVTYDALTDTLRFTADDTGAGAVTLADTTGNFLAAMGVSGGAEVVTTGQLASYRINGGATRTSASNIVTTAVPGVTMTLKGTTTASIDVSITPDDSGLAKRLSDMAGAYNALAAEIAAATRHDENGDNDGPLMGDSTVTRLSRTIRSMLTGAVAGMSGNITTLGAIGLSFGAVGSEVGTTDTLIFDQGVFDQAIASNSDAVRTLLAGFSAQATLVTPGVNVASISGKPTVVKDSGAYTLDMQAGGALTLTFTPDDGTSPIITTHTIAPGEVNASIIPGVTLTFGTPLNLGIDTITVSATQEGRAKSLFEYVDTFTRTGGVFDGRDDELSARITDINEQIDRMETRLDERRERLIQKYARLEVTMQQLQNQQAALGTLVSNLQANSGKKN